MIKDSCSIRHDMIVISKNIFVEDEHPLEETHSEETCVEEIDDVMPCDVKLDVPISIKPPTKPISTSIVLLTLPPILFHSFINPSIFTLLEFETCTNYGPNLDRTHKLDVTIGLKDLVEDLGVMSSLCIHSSCETSRSLSSTLSDVGDVCNSYNWA